jgi:CRP-like cAMP-binding protein
LLRSIPLFEGLNDRGLARVDCLLTIHDVAGEELLTEEGTVGRQAFIILSGQAAVTIAGRLIATVGPGEIIGEIALLDRQARTATVTALEPMRVFVVDPRGFNSLLTEPEIARKLLDAEVGRLRVANSVSPSSHSSRAWSVTAPVPTTSL